MKELFIEEQHTILLEIAKTFDSICTKHNIPYYMLGGTMLGAIRHKGFIPWDDDMDFGVPYEYYDELTAILETELPKPFHCATYKNSKCVFFPFIKIEDTTTILDDLSLPVAFHDKIGVNIDVFPLFSCNIVDKKFSKVWYWEMVGGKVFTDSRTRVPLVNGLKRFVRLLVPFDKQLVAQKQLDYAKEIEKGPNLGNILGRWQGKEIIPYDWYGIGIRFQFEDTTFVGLQKYDLYLRQLYSNYEELPPKEQQYVHSDKAYRKDF